MDSNDEVCQGCGAETKLIYCDDCGEPYCLKCIDRPSKHPSCSTDTED